MPLGLSRFSHEPDMRPHTTGEADAVLDTVARTQDLCLDVLGRRLVFASDEYYLMAGRAFPAAEAYEGYPQHENGIGMVRAFEAAFEGDPGSAHGVRPGFFAWVDGAPPAGYRARRATPSARGAAGAPVAILTGAFGARVLAPLVEGREGVRVLEIENRYFGGTIGVAGLLTGTDVAAVLSPNPTASATSSPTRASRRACSSTGGTSRSCRDPSRWSRPTGSRSGAPSRAVPAHA